MGSLYHMDVTAALKVEELRAKIRDRFGATMAEQALYTGDKILRDGLSLHEYNIQKYSQIDIDFPS